MKSQGIVDLFRIEMHDTAIPPMFADEQLYVYLDDAQKHFARETGGIPDSSSVLTELKFAAGDTEFKLDERILKVRDAYRVSDGEPVAVINYEDMAKYGLRFDGSTGPVKALVIGMDGTAAYPHPIPTAADTLKLVIERLPKDDVVDDKTQLEIVPYHHLHLLDHMKALAYGNADAEVFNKAKATEHEERFTQYCFKVKMEKERRKSKVRVVQYGGLPMRTFANDEYKR